MDWCVNCEDRGLEDCTLPTPLLDKLQQIDLWSRDVFDLNEWRKQLFSDGDGGEVRVLHQCSNYCGTVGEGFLPVVFKKFGAMREELGVSADGFWGPLERAEQKGFCFRVKVHGRPGRRQLLILKHPEESQLHAVARAKGAVEQWQSERSGYRIDWVEKALTVELENRMARATAEKQAEGRCAARFSVCQETDVPLIHRERCSDIRTSNLRVSEVRTISKKDQEKKVKTESEGAEAPETPSPPEERAKSTFRNWLQWLLEELGSEVPETVLGEAATLFEGVAGDDEVLRRLVKAKVLRLDADGYDAQKILSFLLEDVDELAVEAEKRQPRRRREPRKTKEKESESTGSRREGLPASEEKVDKAKVVDWWPAVLEELRGKVREDTYEFWIRDLVAVEDEGGVQIVTDDEFVRSWCLDNYGDLLEDAIDKVTDQDLEVRWVDVEGGERVARASQ